MFVAKGIHHTLDGAAHQDFIVNRLVNVLLVNKVPGLPERFEKFFDILR
jgi:hypothetical protein